jgi:hypothetical protein
LKRMLLLSCLLSALVIGVEICVGILSGTETGAADASAGSVPASAGPGNAPKLRMADQSAADRWVGTILGRPLFAADRRPAPSYAVAHAGLPRLAGVIAAPTDAVAIFQAGSGAKPMAVHPGEQINGWHLTLIEADAVTLRKAGVNTVLRPAFTGEEAAPTPSTVANSNSRWVTAASSGILRARWSNPQLQP